MEAQKWCLPASSLRGGLRKGTMDFVSNSVWEKDAFPSHTLMPGSSVPSCMSLGPFELLPKQWSSERVSLSKSMHGLLKRNAWNFRSPLSPSATVPSGFYSQKVWRLLLALAPWARCPGVKLGPLASQRGPPQPSYPSQFLSATRGYGISQFHPSYQSQCGLFFSGSSK